MAMSLFDDANENEFNTTDLGYAIIERHHDAKKDILQTSLVTFDSGKELLERMKDMSNQIEHKTTTACHTIEHLLEVLNDRRRYLEDLWQQRKVKLEQCLQICYLREEIQKTIEWIFSEGDKYLEDTKLGSNYQESFELQRIHAQFEKQHHKPLHDTVMKLMRSADQFVHTGLKNADDVHQFAHVLLEHWEKFARKLDQRRKLLSLVVSFSKQTESATEKLGQLEKDIENEEEKISQIESNNENLTNLHSNLSNQIAVITAPGLRDGKILLEKIDKDDFESQQLIRRVSEFNEHVKELKTKIVSCAVFVVLEFY
jgi:hypothetical protein